MFELCDRIKRLDMYVVPLELQSALLKYIILLIISIGQYWLIVL